MASSVEQVKDRLSILDVISSYIKLQKAGKDYKGLSPFTKEKSPSFFVSPDRGVYYCFSTNKGGDMFTFIQEIEGVDFRGALRILAERAGVEIVPEKPGEKDKRERLFGALEEATKFYQAELAKNNDAQAYVKQRGITEKTVASFRIGYAPAPDTGGWRPLTTHLEKKGYTRQEITEAGLAKKGERGDLYDQFRGRVMFPFFDVAGRPIAFSGRLYPDDPHATKKGPKYLNSPDTELFHKSLVLYGYDKARGGIRKFNFAMLVEGQMDLVLSHQAGFGNTTAVSGTALTREHLGLLKRLTDNLLLAFDKDPAGIRAGLKSAGIALSLGMEVKVAAMPLGKDPADVVRENPQLLKDAIKHATHIIPFALSVFKESEKDPRAYAKRVYAEVVPLLSQIENPIDKAQFVRLLATDLSVREEAVWEALEKTPKKEVVEEVTKPVPQKNQGSGHPLCLIFAKATLLKGMNEKDEAETLLAKAKEIAGIDNFALIQKHCGEGAVQSLIFGLENHPRGAEEILKDFESRVLEKRSKNLYERISLAEKAGDEDEVARLMREKQGIDRRLKGVG